MMDEYAKYSFGLEIKREDRIYNSERTPYAQISDKTPVIKSSGYLKEHKIIENELSKNISKIDSWDNYNKYLIRLPKELIEYENKLSIIKNSPILPNKCQILIDEYLKIIFTNIKQVRELLNEASKELPFKYPTIEKFKDATVDWLWVRYTKIFLSLTPNSDKIIQFIRNYYDSEQVFK
jgi:hypothetical protein